MSGRGAPASAAEPRAFLAAAWRHLAFLNYRADPALLRPRLPRGTELDTWDGHAWLSVVGLLFLDMSVLGVRVPFHQRFEQVNLRFYVQRRDGDGWRRGVVFVKEIVPHAALALAARTLFGERYAALPTSHALRRAATGSRVESVAYGFTDGRENRMEVTTAADPRSAAPESHEAFIVERHWGYTKQRDSRTLEVHVRHPPWLVAPASGATLDFDVERVYGPGFVDVLPARPASAFFVEGSEVTVSRAVRLGP